MNVDVHAVDEAETAASWDMNSKRSRIASLVDLYAHLQKHQAPRL